MNHVFRMNSVTKLFLEKVEKMGYTVLSKGLFSFHFGSYGNWVTIVYIPSHNSLCIQSSNGIYTSFKDWGEAEQFIQDIGL